MMKLAYASSINIRSGEPGKTPQIKETHRSIKSAVRTPLGSAQGTMAKPPRA